MNVWGIDISASREGIVLMKKELTDARAAKRDTVLTDGKSAKVKHNSQ